VLFIAILILVTLGLLVTQRVRIEITAIGVVVALGFSRILTPAEALSGFSSPATITVGAMLVLSAGLKRSGVVDYIGAFLAGLAHGKSPARLLAVMALPTALLSAFINNTAIVALMIPVALTLARRFETAPSRLLLPISYLSILGGTCTLIGTSTNILVDSLYRQAGGPGFGMFEFTRLGVVYLAIGGAYVVLVASRVLPERTALSQFLDTDTPGHFITEVTVPAGSGFVGRQLGEVIGKSDDVRVLELIRDESAMLRPDPNTFLHADDVLLIEGTARTIHDMLNQRRVVSGTAVSDAERVPISRIDLRMVEAVITPNSRFLHRKVRDLGLSRRLGIHVLAVRRLGRHHQYNLRDLHLISGDVLLLQGEQRSLRGLQEEGDVLLVEGVEHTLTFPRKAPVALAILVAVVALAALNVAPIVLLSLAGVAAMLATGCLTLTRATRALDSSVLFLLAGVIPLGLAMERTGLAASIAVLVGEVAGSRGPLVLIGMFYLMTSLLTEFLSNNAAAVFFTPICLGVAAQMGIDPKPLLIAVTFGASASFSTPIGYQTNTMVMGPGGYAFRDYLRAGVPLNLIMWGTATLLIPIFWPP
jgi:di/tricarboxylate transporter